MITHYTIIVTGQVQKVGFRFQANLEANRNNLTGFVRNDPDGSVYILKQKAKRPISAISSNGARKARGGLL